MTIGRDIIVQAFPGQPRMQAAVEALFADADTALGNLNTALEAIASLSGDTEGIVGALAAKQPKNATLDAISALGSDPGVLEQIQAGIFSIRPIDAADALSLMTRELADTRYLGGAHGAISAAKWTTARSITITGDGSWTVSMDGSANVSAALTIPVFTSTVKGTVPASGGGTTNFLRADGTWAAPGSVTPAALTKTDDANVTLTLGGTPATALLQAVSVTVGWTGQLSAARGGTGIGSYAVGDILFASGASALSKLAGVATGNVLISGGVTTAPSWGKVGLTTHVSGSLPLANGGTAGTDAATARTNLGLVIGTDVQAFAATNGARVFNSAAISVANNTPTALTFDSERRDDGNVHSTVSNTDRLTAPTAGWYYIWGNVEYANNATGFRTTSIRMNVGAIIIAAAQAGAVNGDNTIMNTSCLYYLAAGDYVRLFVYQNSGGALNINGPSAGFTYSPEFAMVKVAA